MMQLQWQYLCVVKFFNMSDVAARNRAASILGTTAAAPRAGGTQAAHAAGEPKSSMTDAEKKMAKEQSCDT